MSKPKKTKQLCKTTDIFEIEREYHTKTKLNQIHPG